MAAIKHDEWWKHRVGVLERIAKDVGTCGHEVWYEKDGFWPATKLVIMQYGFPIYLRVMRGHVGKPGFWDSLHYVDLCAGSGLTLCRPSVRNGQQVVSSAKPKMLAGTALIAADEERRFASEGKRAFDSYHFVERHGPSLNALRDRVRKLVPEEKSSFYQPKRSGDAVSSIAEKLRKYSKDPHFLVVVDPDGLTEVTLPELEALFKLGRGDVMFNFQYMGLKRAPDAATDFFGRPDWPRTGTEDELREYFHKRMAGYNRGITVYFDVKAGGSRYGYEVAYSAARTKDDTPWLTNMDRDLSKRVSGLDGQDIERILFGQTTLF